MHGGRGNGLDHIGLSAWDLAGTEKHSQIMVLPIGNVSPEGVVDKLFSIRTECRLSLHSMPIPKGER